MFLMTYHNGCAPETLQARLKPLMNIILRSGGYKHRKLPNLHMYKLKIMGHQQNYEINHQIIGVDIFIILCKVNHQN